MSTPASSGSTGAGSGTPPGTVSVNSLPIPTLRTLQNRLTTELEHLTSSHAKLRAAQTKFRDCVRSINEGVISSPSDSDSKDKKGTEGAGDGKDSAAGAGGGEILVPLTSSLYVKGQMADREKVLVDVGTGFYVEKTTGKAIEFYDDKVKGLDSNLQELEKIVQSKNTQLRLVEDVLRQKVLNGEAVPAPAAAAGAG